MANENEPQLTEDDKQHVKVILRGWADGGEALRIAERFAELARENYRLRSELIHLESMFDRPTVPHEAADTGAEL